MLFLQLACFSILVCSSVPAGVQTPDEKSCDDSAFVEQVVASVRAVSCFAPFASNAMVVDAWYSFARCVAHGGIEIGACGSNFSVLCGAIQSDATLSAVHAELLHHTRQLLLDERLSGDVVWREVLQNLMRDPLFVHSCALPVLTTKKTGVWPVLGAVLVLVSAGVWWYGRRTTAVVGEPIVSPRITFSNSPESLELQRTPERGFTQAERSVDASLKDTGVLLPSEQAIMPLSINCTVNEYCERHPLLVPRGTSVIESAFSSVAQEQPVLCSREGMRVWCQHACFKYGPDGLSSLIDEIFSRTFSAHCARHDDAEAMCRNAPYNPPLRPERFTVLLTELMKECRVPLELYVEGGDVATMGTAQGALLGSTAVQLAPECADFLWQKKHMCSELFDAMARSGKPQKTCARFVAQGLVAVVKESFRCTSDEQARVLVASALWDKQRMRPYIKTYIQHLRNPAGGCVMR